MKNGTRKMSQTMQVCLIALFSAAFVMIPDFAFAQFHYVGGGTESIVGDAMCFAAAAFAGEIAAGIATVAVCTLGTLACVGRVQWTTALILAVGISVIFG